MTARRITRHKLSEGGVLKYRCIRHEIQKLIRLDMSGIDFRVSAQTHVQFPLTQNPEDGTLRWCNKIMS